LLATYEMYDFLFVAASVKLQYTQLYFSASIFLENLPFDFVIYVQDYTTWKHQLPATQSMDTVSQLRLLYIAININLNSTYAL